MQKRKNKKKTVAVCAALVGILAVGGMGAYFTDFESVENKFVIGKVDIELDEPHFPKDDPKVIPKTETPKDPTIKLKDGSANAYIYATVEVPAKKVALYDNDGNKIANSENTLSELFTYTVNSGWVELESEKQVGTDKVIHVYVWGNKTNPTTVTAGNSTNPIFNSVTFVNTDMDSELSDTIQKIIVNGYGIQTSDLGTDETILVWNIIAHDDEPLEETPVKKDNIVVSINSRTNPSGIDVYKNSETPLTVSSSDGSELENIKIVSENNNIAKIEENKIVAISEGETIINVSADNSETKNINVKVMEKNVVAIIDGQIVGDTFTIEKGFPHSIDAVAPNYDFLENVQISSSNTSVATIEKNWGTNQLVTGVSGTTTITITANDFNTKVFSLIVE